MKPRPVCIFLFLLVSRSLFSQGTKIIEIIHSNSFEYDQDVAPDVRRLIGDVIFQHGDATMYCDSAWFYNTRNVVDAFGNVHVQQGDTLDLLGDKLTYDGNTKLAQIQGKVTLVDKQSTLKTDYLDYDVNSKVAHYTHRSVITNGENTLVSNLGDYKVRLSTFYFKDSIVINNPDYTILSDTLEYNTKTKTAFFFGPTQIIGKQNYIYCEKGWYNTALDISQFNKNAYLKNKEQTLKGDSLYYDRNLGIGKAFRNIELRDTTKDIILRGEFAIYNEEPERAFVTGNALLIQVNSGDSIFIHGDTLRSDPDSTMQYKLLRAFHHVKMFKEGLQGMCDSLSYSTSDSIMRLYSDPVLWSGANQQLSSGLMLIYTKDRRLDYIEMLNSAIIVEQKDTGMYNQIKGKKMIGYFKGNELQYIDVKGNGETVYYLMDDKNELVGINKAVSASMVIRMKDKKTDRVDFIEKPEGTIYPFGALDARDLLLDGFKWLDHFRPKQKQDIFKW